MVIDPQQKYRAWLETEYGTIVLDLFADIAPQTVNNFAYLACQGYYDGITWHRVVPGFVAQTGDPTSMGVGGPGYNVNDENGTPAYLERGLQFDRAGLLSMAKGGAPNSAGSQFFITYAPASHLNADFTIFGEVIAGLATLDSLTPREAAGFDLNLPAGDALLSVVVRQIDG
jgi:peptidylprolyl isomerase